MALQLLDGVIFSAGFDYQSNPIFVICPSRLSPSVTNLSVITQHALDLFSSVVNTGPYSIIIFASPSEHAPSFKQLVSSYQLISQPIRKNLKSILVVHPSFWSKITFQLFLKTVVSSKIYKKIKYVKDLSSLASMVPIHQICIPPEVYKHDLTIEPAIVIPPSSRQPPVFETSLEELMGLNSQFGLPQIIKDCTECIISSGLKSEGLFRRPPSLTTTQIIRDAYDRRQVVKIEDYPDAPFLAASLLKLFLRELPDPIFLPELYPIFKNCPNVHLQPIITTKLHQFDLLTSNQDVLLYIKDHILIHLNKPSRTLLDSMLRLCHHIALHSEHNRMDPHNLATCLAPTMIRSDDLLADAMMCKFFDPSLSTGRSLHSARQSPGFTTFSSILKFMISCYPLFEETQDSIASPTCSGFSTPSGSQITGDQSTYSSNETFNSLSFLSESSFDSISSTNLITTSIFEPNNHQQQYIGMNHMRRIPSSIQAPLKNGYIPIRCPVSQVGLSHAFSLGESSSTPLSFNHEELARIPRFNYHNLKSPSPLTRTRHHHSINPLSPSSSFLFPSITERIVPSLPLHLNSTLPVSHDSDATSFSKLAFFSDSYHRLDELD